jgi:hypothetical protein
VGYGLYMPSGGTNYGEKITVDKCIFDGAATAIYNNNGSGDIHVTQSSIDYCHCAVNVQHGGVSLDEVFVETSFDDNNHFICQGYGSTLTIGYMQLTDTLQTQRTKEFFLISDDSTDIVGAGLRIDTLKTYFGYSATPLLVKGTGICDVNRVIDYKDSKRGVIARGLNKLAFGNCDSANSISEWATVASSISPTVDNTVFSEGAGSLKFSRAASGTTGSVAMRKTFKMKAGQTFRMRFKIKTSGLTASGVNLDISRVFLNDVGTAITASASMYNITNDVSDWAEVVLAPSVQVPQGTDSIQITIWAGNWTTAITAWMDDIVVNII